MMVALSFNGSVASVKGTPAFGVYAASKAAIRSFVRTWTTDLKDRRIRSNVVSPGPINTPLASRQSADVIARKAPTTTLLYEKEQKYAIRKGHNDFKTAVPIECPRNCSRNGLDLANPS